MAGITLCANTSCPLRPKCYQATAKPNTYSQAYEYFEPVVAGSVVRCGWFKASKVDSSQPAPQGDTLKETP